jgi:hypothetical protein
MSKNGTIVTDVIKPFKGTGWFRSSNAETIDASKERFYKNYAAGNFSDDMNSDIGESELAKVPVVESCKKLPECIIYNYDIPEDMLKADKKGKQKAKIERRIVNEEQQASKMARINDSHTQVVSGLNTTIQDKETTIGDANKNTQVVSGLNTTIQGKDTTISDANKNIESLQAQISPKSEPETNLKSSETEQAQIEPLVYPPDIPQHTLDKNQTPNQRFKKEPIIQKKKEITAQDINEMNKILKTILEYYDIDNEFEGSIGGIKEYLDALLDSPHESRDNYFMFFNKTNPHIFLVGKEMQYYSKKLTTAVKFISNFGICTYCSISKLEKNFYFVIGDKETHDNMAELFEVSSEIHRSKPEITQNNLKSFQEFAMYNMLSSDEISRKENRPLTVFKGMFQKKEGGRTRRRNRKTRRKHATKKHRGKQLKTHRRKGRRVKRKSTRRR